MLLNHLSVFRKLWVLVLSIVIPFFLLQIGIMTYLTHIENIAETQVHLSEERIAMAIRWRGMVTLVIHKMAVQTSTSDMVLSEKIATQSLDNIKDVSDLQEKLSSHETSEEGKLLLGRIANMRAQALSLFKEASEKRKDGDMEAASKIIHVQAQPIINSYIHELDQFVKFQEKQRDIVQQIANQERNTSIQIGIGIAIVVSVLGLLLASKIVASITTPLNRAVVLADAIASGDLTQNPYDERRDELGSLLRSLSTMTHKLRNIISEVRSGVESVSTASNEIATGNYDLSVRTEKSAANLEETAASMEELTATVTQSAETARLANQLAAQAAQAAERGGDVVGQVVTSMEDITQSSRKINDIIGVIDGIAFQTNILALNAAVEAARAGEQGRGFAVVAGEVRLLAKRSADAAKEIKSLITASVKSVQVGSEQVEQAGQSMGEIVDSVRRVSDLIGEISASSSGQRDGIGQVNQAVTNLDQITQQNAALVEEASAAATSLSEQAQRLLRAVSVFNLGLSGATGRAVMPAPARTLAAEGHSSHSLGHEGHSGHSGHSAQARLTHHQQDCPRIAYNGQPCALCIPT